MRTIGNILWFIFGGLLGGLDPGNALDALMFVLAIDAEKCSRN